MAALTRSAVAEIVKSVGLDVKVDETALLNDLDWSESWFRTHRTIKNNSAIRGLFEKIEASALKLDRLLNQDVQQSLPISDDHRVAVRSIQKAAAQKLRPGVTAIEAKLGEELGRELRLDRLSAFQWLAGERLTAVFK